MKPGEIAKELNKLSVKRLLLVNISNNLFKDSLKVKRVSDFLNLDNSGLQIRQKLSGIEIRMSKVFIKENGTDYIPFISRYSDLYFISSVIDDVSGKPLQLCIRGFENVDDCEQLNIDRTLYYWKPANENDKVPGQIHTLVSIVKSYEGIRNIGEALADFKSSGEYKSLILEVANLIAGGGTSAVQDGLVALTSLIGSVLGNVDDTPLITVALSFTDINGDLTNLGKTTYARSNRNVDLLMNLVVRNNQ